MTELVVVVEILMARVDGDGAPGDEGAQGALDPVGVAAMAEAGRHLVKERQKPIDLKQQPGTGIGSHGTAVNSGHHRAAAKAFKLQRFGGRLYAYRFSSWNLVNC